MSVGEGTGVGFSTMRGRDYPTLRQFTVFLENRVGQLMEVVRRFEGSRVKIVAFSINDATSVGLFGSSLALAMLPRAKYSAPATVSKPRSAR